MTTGRPTSDDEPCSLIAIPAASDVPGFSLSRPSWKLCWTPLHLPTGPAWPLQQAAAQRKGRQLHSSLCRGEQQQQRQQQQQQQHDPHSSSAEANSGSPPSAYSVAGVRGREFLCFDGHVKAVLVFACGPPQPSGFSHTPAAGGFAASRFQLDDTAKSRSTFVNSRE